MKIIDILEDRINRFPKGYIFTYLDFEVDVKRKETVVQALNRLLAEGKIAKFSKGRYYKSQKTEFGELSPSFYQIAKDYIEKDGKMIGYLTGYSVYNSLYLTTQIANEIQIGTNKYRRAVKRGLYKVSFVVQPNKITKENFRLLQIIDCVRFIKQIPAATPDESCLRFKQIFKELTPKQQITLVNLALNYTDYVRALCGAILEAIGADNALILKLKKSLNEMSEYNIYISKEVLPNKKEWRIV
jgi:hypothetical protein